MNTLSLNQFLMLYTWFPLAALLIFLLLIARFFERFSGVKTYFRLFLLPLIFFGAAAVRYAGTDHMAGDLAADAVMGVAGLVLLGLSLRLYWVMIYRRRT